MRTALEQAFIKVIADKPMVGPEGLTELLMIELGRHTKELRALMDGQPEEKSLTFGGFRTVNVARSKRWGKGKPFSVLFHSNELGEEAGEVCGVVKKLERFRMGVAGGIDEATAKEHLAKELADVVTVADLLANVAGIDLGEAVKAKFNEVSKKHGFPEKL